MDADRFDTLTRRLTRGGRSRRAIIKSLAGSALAGTATLVGITRTEAACSGDFCHGVFHRCGPEGSGCVCYTKRLGGTACAAPFGECIACQTNADCRDKGFPGYECGDNGPYCCGGKPGNICAAPCSATKMAATASGARGWTPAD